MQSSEVMPEPVSILLQVTHPTLERSRVNRRLLGAVSDIDGITVNDLYQHYPDGLIDVAREQALLNAHDLIVFQHPLFWYSAPALLKEWQDLVLEYGYAYGPGGDALQGKWSLSVITAGGGRSAYCEAGYNHYGISTLLTPFEQTARYCGMRPLPPYVIFGALDGMKDDEIRRQASAYGELMSALAGGDLSPQALQDRGVMEGADDLGPCLEGGDAA